MKTSKARRRTIGILIAFLLFVFSTEWLLSTFDPLGINRYDTDLRAYFNWIIQADNGLFVMPDGTHEFSNWTATIVDGARVTATQPGDCHIAFMGDSVAFGLGVNDSDGWVNLLALQYPAIEIRNYAYPNYNVNNLHAAFQQIQADGYVYLIIDNDAGRGTAEIRYRPPSRLWSLGRYLLVLTTAWQQAQRETTVTPEYRTYLESLPAHTLILGFEDEVLAEYAAEQHGAILIPRFTSTISFADAHPDATGHQQIHAAVQPYVDAFISRVCG